MSHKRGLSVAEGSREPHSVSLKVLRLSKPSLSTQYVLPTPTASPAQFTNDAANELSIDPVASRAFPSTSSTDFILSPLLTLPPAFGSAYVGETFSCTLCANVELTPAQAASRAITSIKIEAEMRVPSTPRPVGPTNVSSPRPRASSTSTTTTPGATQLTTPRTLPTDAPMHDFPSGSSVQEVIHFDLKEEGTHVLSVTVTYTERTTTATSSSSRVRTFRKLYQFLCKACLIVRTKTALLPPRGGRATRLANEDPVEAPPPMPRRWVLEAQLENSGDDIIVLEALAMEMLEGWRERGINWDVDHGIGRTADRDGEGGGDAEGAATASAEPEQGPRLPLLRPGDVEQVCFVIEELLDRHGRGREMEESDGGGGRYVFGLLSIAWRGSMGNKGFLSTDLLGSRAG